MPSAANRVWRLLVALLVISSLLSDYGCEKRNQFQSLDTLFVLTRNAPTTYYIGANEEPRGFEYELIAAFADSAGVVPKFVMKNSIADILEAMDNGTAAIAAAGITRTDERQDRFQFSPPYLDVQQQVVYRRGGPSPDSVADLIGIDLTVIDESSYTEQLPSLQQEYHELTWEVTTELSTEELMEDVASGSLDVTIADANIVAINQRYYPELRVALPISETQQLAWVINKEIPGLANAISHWFESIKESGHLAALKERYYGPAVIFDYVDIRAFHRRIESRLPRYENYFRNAAKRYDFSWVLLAAQAYQESHWRRNARSPTGVRGMMMLTQITAKSVGVTNRLDPRQSIFGGARYLRRLLDRLPDDIPPRQKIRFALAAYNVGWGHLMDARTLAKRLNYDPNDWSSMAEVLPLLSHKEYYTTLKYGYARGTEPVRYVHRILNYRDILNNQLPIEPISQTGG